MLKSIALNNFKCLSDCDIPLKNVTILAGQNSAGKSTAIQSLLLLRQSYDKFHALDKVITSGELIRLGKSNDIFNEYAIRKEIGIEIRTCAENVISVIIPYVADNNLLSTNVVVNSEMESFNVFRESFEYIAADRIVPQDIYSSINYSGNLGIHGEKVFSYLSSDKGNKPVSGDICVENVPEGLYYQTNYWINKLFHGFNFNIQEILEADSISLRYQEKDISYSSNEYRPINVGFGITYALPVVVALLKAKSDDLVIIENPECHLHPKAQRQIGELIAKVGNSGAQVILETHSDHILNGIRIAAKNKIIPADKTQILFFDREYVSESFNTNVYAPNIMEDGSLDYWPEGFFDEWDNALTELI
jgi:predicted ATPase